MNAVLIMLDVNKSARILSVVITVIVVKDSNFMLTKMVVKVRTQQLYFSLVTLNTSRWFLDF